MAVEIKSFINPSLVKDLENALGQYILYASLIQKQQPLRTLYLAVREEIYVDFFTEEIVQIVLEFQHIKLLIFDAQKEEIVKWIN
ncbi:element excision factor XisH family protein [Crocosphaera sp. XPORK-15E]|uniref:element excision factor XisH family protein n=1 Tax=Crocosphaera sp. XPORK-15E TaxID=3110247 RepID=UPI002B205370|nr:element excision factor XisH family protein [Crocosphaera sp. XPORK-15E]MEA5535778.1 element excision factor XisH family protein [Crocosphaera sp. XPORK-15E]